MLDLEVGRQTKNATADAIQEVQRYLAEGNIARSQDPLAYWKNQKTTYPNLFQLSIQFLCTPASSVPCEWVFSTAGEVVSKKRNRLNFKTLEKLFFLNTKLVNKIIPVHKHPHSQHIHWDFHVITHVHIIYWLYQKNIKNILNIKDEIK